MIKNSKFFFVNLILFISFLFYPIESNTSEKIIFLSLKNDKVNLRLGPSFEYPIKLIYKKKYLPVLVFNKSETWRKVKDYNNNSGWIHISQLSRRKSAINIENNSIIYKKPTVYSRPIARLEIGRLVLIKKCVNKWCKVTTGEFSGWLFKSSLWGKTK